MKKGLLINILDLAEQPSRKQATILQAIGGYINTGITVVQGLLLIPLYLHYIGAHTYGLWLASGGILIWLGFMDLGINSMMVQRIANAYGQKDFQHVGEYFFNGFFIYLIVAILFLAIGFVVSIWLPEFIGAIEEAEILQQCFFLAVVAAAIDVLNSCLRGFPQALLRPVFPMTILIVSRIIGLAVTVFMLIDGFGLWAIPVGSVITAAIALAINSVYASILLGRLGEKVALKAKILGEYMKTSPALFAGRAGNAIVGGIEPLIITILIRPEVATAYVVIRRMADIVLRLLQVILVATAPSFSHLVGEASDDRKQRTIHFIAALVYIFGLAGFGTYIAINKSFVLLWVGEGYFFDFNLILLVGVSMFALAIQGSFYKLLMSMGDMVVPSLLMFLEALSRVGIMYILLQAVGINGVPSAVLVSILISLIIYSHRLNKIYPIEVSRITIVKASLGLFVVFITAYALMHVIEISSWIELILYSCLISLSYLGVGIMTNPVLLKILGQMNSVQAAH